MSRSGVLKTDDDDHDCKYFQFINIVIPSAYMLTVPIYTYIFIEFTFF